MADEREIKRYEPLAFLLVLGMVAIALVLGFALFKFRRSLQTGYIVAPELAATTLAAALVLTGGYVSLVISRRCWVKQRFGAFRSFLALAFLAWVLFIVVQAAGLPAVRAADNPSERGYYYLAFLAAVHLLLVLAGVVATGVLLAKAFRAQPYVESFIFSVNPPNVLNMKLLLRYMGFVTSTWLVVILFLYYHAA